MVHIMGNPVALPVGGARGVAADHDGEMDGGTKGMGKGQVEPGYFCGSTTARIRSLEAENARLQARVKELEREYVELLNRSRYPKPS